jgi:hypothetical protein
MGFFVEALFFNSEFLKSQGMCDSLPRGYHVGGNFAALVGVVTIGVRKIKNPPVMPNLFRHPIRKVTALQVIRLPCTLIT